MRKIFVAILAATALLAGCAKENVAPEQAQKEIKVTFTVADKSNFGPDTKAAKADWEDGDAILIAMQNGDGTWTDNNGNFNCLKLSYKGNKWSYSMTGFDDSKLSIGTAKYVAIHHSNYMSLGDRIDNYVHLDEYQGGDILQFVGEDVTYTYDGTEINLGKVQMKRPENQFQISVRGLSLKMSPGYGRFYIKKVDEDTKADGFSYYRRGNVLLSSNGLVRYADNDENSYSTGYEFSAGYEDADGPVDDLVFIFDAYNSKETALRFVLKEDCGKYFDVYTYTTTTIPQKGKAYYLPAITDSKWTYTKVDK